jgi:hypothetical protein
VGEKTKAGRQINFGGEHQKPRSRQSLPYRQKPQSGKVLSIGDVCVADEHTAHGKSFAIDNPRGRYEAAAFT